jgi:hypothetical protein
VSAAFAIAGARLVALGRASEGTAFALGRVPEVEDFFFFAIALIASYHFEVELEPPLMVMVRVLAK